MIRTILGTLIALLVTFLVAPLVIGVALFSSHSPLIDRIARFWGRTLVRAAGVQLEVEGMEKLDPTKRYILAPNHSSYLDIPCILAGLDSQPIRFMAKASLFKVPIFGWGLSAAGFIPIDRKRTSKGKASFDLAAKRIRGGNTIVIFPEGGRSRERTMKPFKHGAFLLAMKSGLPLVPVAVVGSYDVLPAGRFAIHPGPVKVIVADPVDVSELSVRQKNELIVSTRRTILDMLGQTEERTPEAAAEVDEETQELTNEE